MTSPADACLCAVAMIRATLHGTPEEAEPLLADTPLISVAANLAVIAAALIENTDPDPDAFLDTLVHGAVTDAAGGHVDRARDNRG